MALMTNYPIALAPGMGLNAFFAFTMCGAYKVPWQGALGLVFWEGVVFLLLTLTGVRQKIVEAIPASLKVAIGCGIGLFIAFIGLKNGGVIVANPATFVGLGDLSQPGPLLVLFGILLTAVLIIRRVPGAIILGVLALTVLGLFLARLGVPTVMMFVQSLNGLSHNAAEDTEREHLKQAVVAFGRLAEKAAAWVGEKP